MTDEELQKLEAVRKAAEIGSDCDLDLDAWTKWEDTILVPDEDGIVYRLIQALRDERANLAYAKIEREEFADFAMRTATGLRDSLKQLEAERDALAAKITGYEDSWRQNFDELYHDEFNR
jgi:hypothetical protein